MVSRFNLTMTYPQVSVGRIVRNWNVHLRNAKETKVDLLDVEDGVTISRHEEVRSNQDTYGIVDTGNL